MARLLIRLLLLTLPFVAFLAWFERQVGGRDNNVISLKRHLLDSSASEVEVLLLGSSHEHSIAAELLHPQAFNLSSWGQSLDYDVALVERCADRLPKLRLVIQPISYFSLQWESVEPWRAYYYQRFWDIPNPDYHRRLDTRNYSCWFLYGREQPWAALRGRYPPEQRGEYNAHGGHALDCDDPKNNTPEPDRVAKTVASRLSEHHSGMRVGNMPRQRGNLERELRLLKQRSIPIVFIQSPLSSGYRSGRRQPVLDSNAAVIRDLCARFGARYHDYSDDPRFSDEDFYDANHLGCRGGQKFARVLEAEVVAPFLRPQP